MFAEFRGRPRIGANPPGLVPSTTRMHVPKPGFVKWTRRLNEAPNGPGVYFLGQFRDCLIHTMYVGKAKHLRSRLRQQQQWDHPMMTHACWRSVATYEHAHALEQGYLEAFLPDLPWNKAGPREARGFPAGTMHGGLPGYGQRRR